MSGGSLAQVLPEDYCKEDPCNFHGWGVGEESTKSWPTFEQLCVQDLAWAISYCFPPAKRTKSGGLEVDQRVTNVHLSHVHFVISNLCTA